MQRKFLPSEKEAIRLLICRLAVYGCPGFWKIRAAVFHFYLFLLDRFFLLRDFWKERVYIREVDRHRFEVRRGTSDDFVIDEIWRKFAYGKKSFGTVIDLGGNIGAYSIFAARTAEKVITVEPVQDNYNQIVRNLQLNNVCNVFISKVAVGAKKAFAEIYIHPINIGMSSFHHEGNAKRKERVEIQTLQFLIEEYKINKVDFLKCDIEGGEFLVFNYKSEKTLKVIDSISMEIHCNYFNVLKVYRLLLRFMNCGFSIEFTNLVFLFLTGTGIIELRKELPR